MAQKYPLIIMAGSDRERSDELLDYAGVDYKALIELNGKPILEYIIGEMQKSGIVSWIYVVGLPEDQIRLSDEISTENLTFLEIPDENVPERTSVTAKRMIEDSEKNPNIFPGKTYHTLFVTGDIPFIKGHMIKYFVDEIGDPVYNLYATIVNKEVMEKRFPTSKRTFGKLTEGYYCLADISCMDISMVDERLPKIRILRKNRKKFITTLLKLTPITAMRFIFRRMGIKHLENATNKVFNISSRFIELPFAETAMDVDKPRQLDLARNEFSKPK